MQNITQKEFDLILTQNPTNNDLRYLIECTNYKEQAWEQLLKQNPTKNDLRYLIKYTSYKEQAWELLNDNKKMIDIIKNRFA